MADILLETHDLQKSFGGVTATDNVSLQVEEGECHAVIGPNGAGKTTLIKLMAGLEVATEGRVLFDDQDVTRVSTKRRNISLVHQFFINYPNMTVYENIASPLRVAGMKTDEIKRRAGEAAELMRLTPMLDRRPDELSGGQQQRTALARAIVKDSRLVLLDEPLANLDYKLREELRDELPRLFADKGAVVVYATSEPHEALLLGGHTACMAEGRITQFGPTADIYRNPSDLPTAQVFSDPPINAAKVQKQGADIVMGTARWSAAGPIASAPDGDYTMGVRPHYVSPVPDQSGVQLTGRVLVTELSGSESVAHFDLSGDAWVSQSHGVHPYQVGEAHDFYVDTSGCLYFDAAGRLIAA